MTDRKHPDVPFVHFDRCFTNHCLRADDLWRSRFDFSHFHKTTLPSFHNPPRVVGRQVLDLDQNKTGTILEERVRSTLESDRIATWCVVRWAAPLILLWRHGIGGMLS